MIWYLLVQHINIFKFRSLHISDQISALNYRYIQMHSENLLALWEPLVQPEPTINLRMHASTGAILGVVALLYSNLLNKYDKIMLKFC